MGFGQMFFGLFSGARSLRRAPLMPSAGTAPTSAVGPPATAGPARPHAVRPPATVNALAPRPAPPANTAVPIGADAPQARSTESGLVIDLFANPRTIAAAFIVAEVLAKPVALREP